MELTVRTGENIGFLPWTPAVMAETGGELLMIHVCLFRYPLPVGLLLIENASLFKHDDLMRLLHKLATDAGAKVDINAPVQSIHAGISDSKPSITLLDGEELRADLLIGADGSNSIVRNVVLGEANRAKPGGLTVYSGIIDAEKMLSDPELRPLVLTDDVSDASLAGKTMLKVHSGLFGQDRVVPASVSHLIA